mmetsp:Transcript_5980/g.11311  ORF Transcript_5980/g.11311 Transcript_5980/m.11311 type:complete len:2522 (+) Transcript_5980:139-7704(+)
MPRERRSTIKAIDYAKVQDFSDDDIFEDSATEGAATVPSTTLRRRGRPRKSEVMSEYGADGVLGSSDDFYQADSVTRYYEKGYDMSLPHIRDRFTFMPELEADGSPKVELIVGRRLISNGRKGGDEDEDGSDMDGDSVSGESQKREKHKTQEKKHHTEYEYLIKYKGVSYLHLEWKSASDLESMNKSAKTLYRRYLKKLQLNQDEDLEDPDFDPSYIQPQKIIDEDEHEIVVELSDEELANWEKEQKKDTPDESDEEDEEMEDIQVYGNGGHDDEKKEETSISQDESDAEEIGEPGTLSKEEIMRILNKEGPYYPVVEGSDNPYRDGYVTEPPKKPRASYLFFQGVYRSVYQKRNPGAGVGQVMSLLGDTWRNMTEEQQAPFIELAKEEVAEYEKQKVLLEKAQRPNGLWQPLRRCKMVLDRLSKDSFAEIFLEPVDLNEFPDYLEYVESPMDLSTVRQRLDAKKYMGPENFARDMRKIWSNCKVYNQHGSAIWYVADYMSKQFERLYAAWVLAYRDRYLRWADPKARPWEPTCRVCDGKCKSPDEKMVLCDHCDSHNSMSCLDPPLTEVPKGVWHCPECAKKIKKDPSARLLSAVAEQGARKRAELGDVPMKKIIQTKYLVKWAGLGYEHCTWETKEDINDDALIAEFHKENNMTPDEPDVPVDDVEKVLEEAQHLNSENAGGSYEMPKLRSRMYAQARAFQFLKFGLNIPDNVCKECGPITRRSSDLDIKSIVMNDNKVMPPLLVGEYDATIPVTSHGLLMNVGEMSGYVAFLGYRPFPDGSIGPAEKKRLIRNKGDKIIAVDGISTVNKSFQEVIQLLKKSGEKSHAHMRFLSHSYSKYKSQMTSMGILGRFSLHSSFFKFRKDRRHLLANRRLQLEQDTISIEEENGEESDGSAGSESDEESDDGTVESFDRVSDDEDLVVQNEKETNDTLNPDSVRSRNPDSGEHKINEQEREAAKTDVIPQEEKISSPQKIVDVDKTRTSVLHQENTRSLALRLLNVDIDYSSDEGGDEDCIYFLDGVDDTFNAKAALESKWGGFNKVSDEVIGNEHTYPAKKNDFDSLGQRAKLFAAMSLSDKMPDLEDFDNFPHPSTKRILAMQNEEHENSLAADQKNEDLVDDRSHVKLSKTKIEQLSTFSNEVIRVWKSAEDAAATLQISLSDLKELLLGRYSEEIGDEVGGYRWRYAAEDADVTKIPKAIKENDKGKKAFLEFRDKLYDHEKPHSYKNGNRLRDYQIDGVNWLASCWYKNHSCILADEMGLGKTVQIVCYIEHLNRVEKIQRPFLVVVPLSTVEHWRREFEGWSDLKVCVYHDRQRVWRDVMREYEWYFADRPRTPDFLKFDVLVTTYDTLIGDFDVIGQIPWRVTVVDEAHRLRNQKGKLLECMKEISAKGTLQHGFQSRVLMTGTPLQNNIQELWTLLNFIEPFKFASLEDFEQRYGNMGSREQVEKLQSKISPFMLRRVKEDVAKDIPAKEETVIDVELTSIQKQYYRAIFEHNHAFLNMGGSRNVAPKLMNIQMELRKCCNHPFLLDGIEQRETEKQRLELMQSGALKDKSPEDIQEILNVKAYVAPSGKMVLLDKLLPKLREEGHKVLIFSQMVKMLDFLGEYCDFRKFKYERLDGRVRGNERQKAIDRFEREEDSFIFMLSTRAGGVGINLTAADTCIIFDSDWNPQNDVQAQARCHRIGQTKQVRIYRLITSRSFETEMFDRASKKLGLEQAVLGTFDNDDDGKPTAKEMEQLLKKGAYALLEDDNDEITKSFCADDIESILAKRTRTRVVEGTKTASWLNKKGMVTKSKFTSESNAAALDMDDPNFWEKVMPNFVTPSIMNGKLEELEMQVTGAAPKKKRGRGRRKKADIEEEMRQKIEQEKETINDDNDVNEDDGEDLDNGDTDAKDTDAKEDEFQLSRANQKKINKFIEDLKSMMDGIFDDIDDDNLSEDEKTVCEKLLLTISCKEQIFSEAQRLLARNMLKRLEGDRRRRCRDEGGSRFTALSNEPDTPEVNEKLMIRSSKKRRKRRMRNVDDEAPDRKRYRRSKASDDEIQDYSDSEGDWSGDDDDAYNGTKNTVRISKKEAKRRRAWATGKDAAKAAGQAWPSFPRDKVLDVLGSLLDKVIKHDKEQSGGVFSKPVPKDQFPEYYEMIKNPMDYSTMKKKLANGDYRSAHAVQKDFVLVMKNCMQFNASDSDIVKEARKQVLLRPKLLREAAMEHHLFLAEDGAVIEVYSDSEAAERVDEPKKRRGRKPGPKPKEKKLARCMNCAPCLREDCGECEACLDKLKFGGTGTLKQSCVHRNCEHLKEIPVKAKRGRPPKKVVHEQPEESEAQNDSERIPKKKKIGRGKSLRTTGLVDNGTSTHIASSRASRNTDQSDIHLDIEALERKRSNLDGSFKAARKYFTERGPWILPEHLKNYFVDVFRATITIMKKNDTYRLFQEPVTEEEAPGYFDIIKKPMDFGTMLTKLGKGLYGKNDPSPVYEDFLLVLDNCYKYNKGNDEILAEATRLLSILPETYAKACAAVSQQKLS